MRLRISTILCFTLFALTNAAPSRPREESESAKKDDQAVPDFTAGADPFAYMSPEQQGDDVFNDCCAPGPSCTNPCQQPAAPPQVINFAPPPPAAPCCAPGPACANPCAAPPPMLPPPPMPMAPPIMMPPPPAAPCCDPAAPACVNPCGAPPMPMAPPMMAPPMMAPQMMAPQMMAPPMGGPCCDPGVVQQCANPCAPPAAADQEEERQTYAPYPGEITFKLMQKWDDRFLDENSSAFALLAGNVEDAIAEALGQGQVQDQVAPQNNYNPWDPYSQQYGQQQYDAPAQKPTVSNIYFREGYVPGNPSTMPITVAHVMVNGGSDDASKLQALVTPDGSLGDGLKVFKDSFSAY